MKNNSVIRWVLIILLTVVGLYLVIDHGQHSAPYLPFTFLLGCLAMHFFMHGNHGDNNHGEKTNEHSYH